MYRILLLCFILNGTVKYASSDQNNELSKSTNRQNSGVDSSLIEDETDKRILDFFGFKKKPTHGGNIRVPRLMQHLYKSHMGDYFTGPETFDGISEPGFDLPPDHVTERVNTARSYHHIDQDEYLEGMPNHHIRLRFNVSSHPENEVIGFSELLLHREAIQHHIISGEEKLHRINVYQIIKIPDPELEPGGWKKRASGAISRLLDTRLVDTRNSTWERFDVSVATQKWVQSDNDNNHGLLVEIVKHQQDPLSADEQKHVRLKRSLHQELDDQEWHDKRPTLVTYTHDGRRTNLRRRSRAKRNSRRKDSNSSRRQRKRKRKRRNRPCARYNLYVDFSEVGWHEWIVAPHGYDAHYCQGQCLFPLAEHLNATNHAIVQTLTNSVQPNLVPSPCCVPTQLSSISMLYVDEHDLVVLKSYPKMSVEACGCR